MFYIVAQPGSLPLVLSSSVSSLLDHSADAHHECLLSGFPNPLRLLHLCGTQHLTPPDTVDPEDSPNIRSRGTRPPENRPTMPLLYRDCLAHTYISSEKHKCYCDTCYCQQSHMNPLTQPVPELQYLCIHVFMHSV